VTFDLQAILAGKRALRRELAARPVAEKLRMNGLQKEHCSPVWWTPQFCQISASSCLSWFQLRFSG
jgi:hypothetical protein